MKKKFLKVSALLLSALFFGATLAGCDLNLGSSGGGQGNQGEQGNQGSQGNQGNQGEQKQKLPTPEVTISEDGVASWEAVGGALYYLYKIDGGNETPITELFLQLEEGQSVTVKAVSNSDDRADSDFSEPKTYRQGDIVPLTFYAVNDLHGKFMDASNQPGVDEFTTYMKDLYTDPAREEVLLSSGDMWQGTVESSSNKGQLMTEWMNDVGFVSMTLGNHEYDWGNDALTPNSETAEFPFLGINVTYNGSMPSYCSASTVVERSGVRIGIIGAIGDCLSSISGEFQTGLSFATGSRLTTLVKNEANRLRNEEDCDFIVYSIHDGGEDFSAGINSVKNSDMAWYDSSLSDGYVDLVFEGHSHQQYILKDEYGVYHMQGGGENKAVSCAEVTFNVATGDYTVEPKLVGSSIYAKSSIKDDPIVEELYEKYFPDSDPYHDILGRNSMQRNSSTILSTVARLYYEKGVEEWGSEYGSKLVAGGGYLNARSPYNINAGNITYSQLYSVLPFDNHIILGEVTGSALKSFLERRYSNYNKYTIYTTIENSAISDNAKYYIIVDTYTSYYRSNNIKEIARLGDIYARDLLAEFIKGGGWES